VARVKWRCDSIGYLPSVAAAGRRTKWLLLCCVFAIPAHDKEAGAEKTKKKQRKSKGFFLRPAG
jgi:hypothetical protein